MESAGGSTTNSSLPTLPRDGQILAVIMKSLDVSECEPQVVPQLLEFMYRHVTETLQDATLYAEHAGRTEITVSDVRFAIQSKATHSFVAPPSREFMMELAAKKNSEPLPLIRETGKLIHLPPDEYCLFGPQSQISSLPVYKSAGQSLKSAFPHVEQYKLQETASPLGHH